jgi:UDP-N-acetylmuramoylalanine--D-glutamate ligase
MAFADHGAVFIWGFGREGRAVLDHLHSKAPALPVTLVDVRRPDALPEGVDWIDEDALEAALRDAERPLLVKSPGVSLYDPRVDAAIRAGAHLTSQTNLYFETRPDHQRVVAVTGTKGKSTTAALLHHMLKALGVRTALAGNIGEPVITTPRAADIVVLELSSYQIADLVHAPDAFIFLNLSNDHAPWHHGVERYRADKARLARLDPNVTGVMNALEPRLIDAFGHQPNRIWIGAPDSFHARDGEVWRGGDPWGPIPALPGKHNALNACAALAMVEHLGFDVGAAFDSLSDFAGLPHRLQTVHEAGEIIFVDDGLATTPEACVNAVAAFEGRPLVLLVGGEEREQDYAWLAEQLERFDHIAAILALADNGERIVQALASGRHGAKTRFVPEIEDAVRTAVAAIKGDGVVLLSPAAPRGKAYASFTERGAAFTAAAKALT